MDMIVTPCDTVHVKKNFTHQKYMAVVLQNCTPVTRFPPKSPITKTASQQSYEHSNQGTNLSDVFMMSCSII